MASLTFAAVSKSFGPVRAVDGLDLTIADGEFFVILGPSGAGKTTSLRLLAGLEAPDKGRILMDGQDVTGLYPADRDVAFVFQQYSLYPHLSVRDNIAFPLRAPGRRLPPDEIAAKVSEVAALLHIENKLDRKATALSGGEMQRVAIGRALVRKPRLFLMDEPLSSLDAKLREELRVELKRIQRRLGTTTVYVTHDQVEALTLADRIAVMEAGRIGQVGTPEHVYGHPNTLAVARRLGSPPMNILTPATLGADSAAVPPAAAHVAIRPEDVRVSADAPSAAGHAFRAIEHSLVTRILVAEQGALEVRALVRSDQPIHPGQDIRLSFPLEHCQFFDRNGDRLSA